MVPVVFAEANFVLGAPPDWDNAKDGICDDLHVLRDAKQNTFTSMWKPDVNEIAALVGGGYVMVVVKASQHPPIIIAATDPPASSPAYDLASPPLFPANVAA